MIQALINGKESNSLYSEDCLTGIVFERLEYLSELKILNLFLLESISLQYGKEEAITLNSYLLSKFKINLTQYKKYKIFYWSRNSLEGEPDIIIIFYNILYNDGILFLIEAKFKSGISRYDQLLSYHIAINEKIKYFYNSEVSSFKGVIGPLIYLTAYDSKREIVESEKLIKKQYSIFSLKWSNLNKILLTVDKNIIVSNLLSYLRKLSLYEFSGFSEISQVPEIDKLRWYSRNYFSFEIKNDYNKFYRGTEQ